MALGADREQDLDQAGPDQPLELNGGATKVRLKAFELGIEARQSVLPDLPDLAQRVLRRNTFLKINIAEQ